jgi:hypothetical protein
MAPDLVIYHPNGEPFLSLTELNKRRRIAEQRTEKLAAKLRELRIDPDKIGA